MVIKVSKSKPKDLDINIKVNNLEKLVHDGQRWNYVQQKNVWKSRGMGFWGFGSALAIVLSYVKNSSILWAIIHGILSWFYVIFRVIVDHKLFG